MATSFPTADDKKIVALLEQLSGLGVTVDITTHESFQRVDRIATVRWLTHSSDVRLIKCGGF